MKKLFMVISGISILLLIIIFIATLVAEQEFRNPEGFTNIILALGFIGSISALLALGEKE